MRSTRLVTAAAICELWAQSATFALPQSDTELAAALSELRAELNDLRARCDETQQWLTDARSAEIKQLVGDVLADAGQRTLLQGDGATCGFNRNLWVGSADGNFRLFVRGFTQQRFNYDHRNEVTGVPNSTNSEWGFQNRRSRLSIDGHVFDPSWQFKVEFQSTSGETSWSSTDLWVEKRFSDELSVRVGQFKPSYLREFNVAVTASAFADRSSTAVFFLPGRTLGAQATWQGESLRVQATIANAFEVTSNYYESGGLRDISWNSPRIAQYAFLGRAEWRLAGAWEQLTEFTGWRGGEFAALAGVAGQVMKRDNSHGVPAMYGALTPFVVGATADLSLQFNGASLCTWFAFRQVDPDQVGLAAANQYAAVVQGGLFVSDTVELVGRFEYGNADTMPNGEAPVVAAMPSNNGYSVFNAVSVGVNWYIAQQRIRITTDVSYAFTGVGAFADPVANFQRDGTNAAGAFDAHGQVLVRAQLQLMF